MNETMNFETPNLDKYFILNCLAPRQKECQNGYIRYDVPKCFATDVSNDAIDDALKKDNSRLMPYEQSVRMAQRIDIYDSEFVTFLFAKWRRVDW